MTICDRTSLIKNRKWLAQSRVAKNKKIIKTNLLQLETRKNNKNVAGDSDTIWRQYPKLS